MARNWTDPLKAKNFLSDSADETIGGISFIDSSVMKSAVATSLAFSTNNAPATNVALSVSDTSDHIINFAEAGNVSFTVSGLGGNETGTVTFTDTANHQVVVNVDGNRDYSVDLSTLTDGMITSLLSAVNPGGHVMTATGNAVSLDTDKDLNPSLSVDATNSAHSVFTVSGLEGDETGTVTFTDATGHQDVVPIASNGAYSANLSNLTDGTITYLLSVSDPAGNVTAVDPPLNLGDGSANAPAGTPQHPHLLDVNSPSTQSFGETYATRPAWNVAGVDYHVGFNSGVTLRDPTPNGVLDPALAAQGVTLSGVDIYVNGDNQTISGWDFSLHGGYSLKIEGNNDTVTNNKFALGANHAAVTSLIGIDGNNATIIGNDLNGNGLINAYIGRGLIDAGGGGTTTIKYNSIENAFSENIVLASFDPSGVNLILQYNVIENMGLGRASGAHGDWMQVANNPNSNFDSLLISYNTFIQSNTAGGGQGLTWPSQGAVSSETVTNNTFIVVPGGAVNWPVLIDTTFLSGSATVANNYYDPSGGFGAMIGLNAAGGMGANGPYNGTLTTLNNDNIVTGAYFTQNVTSVRQVTSSPSTGNEVPGNTITLTLNFSAAVTVTGAPTLTLNDGGTATYKSGSGTNALSFTYTVAASDSAVSDLAITQVNLPTGATIKDAGGNAANLTDALTTLWGLAVDSPLSGPPPPGVPAIASLSTDSGTVGDHITNDNTLTLTGSAVANSTVKVFDGTTLLGSVAANSSGAWSFATAALANGTHSFTATDTVSGATSAASAAFAVTVDTVAPTAPVISGNAVSSSNVVTLNGTAEANNTVTVFDGTTKLGTATANTSGAWSFGTAPLPNGSHSFTATDMDAAGNTSAVSSSVNLTLSVTVDTAAPAKPVIGSNSVSPSNVVTLNGTAEADSTVTVFDGTTQLGTATANGSGAWSFATASLPNGNHSLTATDTDAAGNTSAVSSSVNLTLSAPVIPADPAIPVNLVTNGSFETGNFSGWTLGGSSGVISAGPQMYINGQSESGQHAAALGSVGSDGILSQTLQTTAGQQYTLSFWLANQSAGPDDFTAKWNGTTLLPLVNASAQGYTQYTFNVTATGATSTLEFDARQDPSHWSLDNISVTTSGPQAPTTPIPTITSFSPDTGVVGDGITDPAILTLTGTAVANSTVTVFDGTTKLGAATADASGAWSLVTAALPDGIHKFTATDTVSGSISAASSALSVTVDTVAPAKPVIGSNSVSPSNVVTLNGTAEADSTVTVFDGTTQLGTATANGSGAWSFATASLPNGNHSLTATDTDAAGNTSAVSSSVNLTLSAPVIPADPAIPVNLVTNGSFETGNFSGWTLGGSSGVISAGPQMYINGQSESGQHAAALGSVGSDGILSQTLQTTAGQQYTLSFWLANQSAGPDDFTAKWNGTTLLPLVNASAQGYTQYTFNVTATGATSTLEFDARQDPSHWSLDNISVSGTQAPTTPMPTVTSPDTGVVGDGITDPAVTVDSMAPAKPVIGSNSVSPSNVVTLNGTAEADSTVTVFDGTTQLGTATANGSGAWSFATASLPNGNHSLTATDTDAAGNTSAVSSSVNLTLSTPVIPANPVTPANLVTNGSFETGNFSGWTLGGSSGVISAGPQMYINGQSESGQHAAALGSVGSDGILSQTLQTTAGQQYTLSFWLANQSAGPDDFTAKWNDTTLLPLVNASAQGYTQYTFNVTATGTTSTLEFDARQDPSHWSLDNISVTASDIQAPTTPMPTVTSPDTGVVGDGITDSFATAALPNGNHSLTATDTDAAGNTSAVSSSVNLTLSAPVIPDNLVTNGSFETGNFSGWMLGGSSGVISAGPQMYINGQSESGQHAAALGSVGSDGILSQTLQTTAGQQYTLSFWLANQSAGPDDFTAKWNDTTLLPLVNASAQGYTQYTFNVTATGTTSTLEFDARQDPSHWSLDNISVTAVGPQAPAAPVIASDTISLNGSLGGQTLNATGGATTLIGGPNDILNGGAGADTFVFPANFGSNTVNNFTPGTDALKFSQSMFATVAAVLNDAQQVGSNVVITHDPQNVVTLHHTQLSNLHASDIHIV